MRGGGHKCFSRVEPFYDVVEMHERSCIVLLQLKSAHERSGLTMSTMSPEFIYRSRLYFKFKKIKPTPHATVKSPGILIGNQKKWFFGNL